VEVGDTKCFELNSIKHSQRLTRIFFTLNVSLEEDEGNVHVNDYWKITSLISY
jgi:hypothetical protein